VSLTAPQYLSPSSISTFQQCPLKFKYSRIDGLTEPPTIHTLLGNFVHDILEGLYLSDPAERSLPTARALARHLWDTKYCEQAQAMNLNEHDFRWKAWWCVENLWQLEQPETISLSGIEHEVKGEVSGVSIRGFIDRYRLADDGTLVVEDYKTGKVPAERYVGDKFQQLFIYALMLSELGVGQCSKVSLLFLSGPKVFERPVHAEDMSKTLATITTTKQQIDQFCEAEDFPVKPSNLCNWCHFKKICPAWRKH